MIGNFFMKKYFLWINFAEFYEFNAVFIIYSSKELKFKLN